MDFNKRLIKLIDKMRWVHLTEVMDCYIINFKV